MQHVTVKGLVIRETDFGDSDRYITVLTEPGARIEVLCRGVRRRGGRLTAAVRLFCWSELVLYRSRDKYTLSDASLVSSFWGVTASMEGFALCCYFSELAGHMSDPGEHTPAVTRLFLYALRALADQKRPVELVKPAFELRLMAESGYCPSLAACGACQREMDGGVLFSVRDGAVLCGDCAQRLGGADLLPLPRGAYAAMAHIVCSDMHRVFSFSLGGDALRQLGGVCEAYALYYAERGFDSLAFYHTLF